MSGHSKWATIRHKKGALDAKRGKIFTKIIKEISVAAKMGGGEEEANPRLRSALLKARAANMPKDNMIRAIKKGTGDLEGVDYTELVYEGYASGGVAVLVETLTDNKNRTAAEVRSIFTKAGGSLGATGSVSYLFNRKGLINFDASKYSEDEIFETALEAGAEDVSTSEGIIEVVCDPQDFEAVLNALTAAEYSNEIAEISMIPETTVGLSNEQTKKALNLIEKLDDKDDVQAVSSKLDITDGFDPDSE